MVFYMGSKVFQNEFLVNESDYDILHTQYVIVSTRIKKHGGKESSNIMIANSLFLPNPTTFQAYSKKEMRERYFKQLDGSKTGIAMILYSVLKENWNVVLLCTESELKQKYLEYLAEYIYYEFKYPVYNYEYYCNGICDLIKYNREKVFKKCKKIKDGEKQRAIEKILDTTITNDHDEKQVRSALLRYKKKDIKQIVMDMDLYEEGMSKKDMIDTIVDFI